MKRIVIALAVALLAGTAPDLLAGRTEEPLVTHTASGVVKKVEPGIGRITLHHDAIAALGWPSMTMPFSVKDRKILASVRPDQKVQFDFVQSGGAPVITAIR